MFKRPLFLRWLTAAFVCAAFLAACGTTVAEREDLDPSGPAVTTTSPTATEPETAPPETTQTAISSESDATVSTTNAQPLTSTTATPTSTPTAVKPTTTTSAPVTSTTAPTPTFEVETVEPEAPGQEQISTVSPSA